MALIICPDCGGKVSDKANACIHCGCPITNKTQSSCLKELTEEINKKSENIRNFMNNEDEFDIMKVNLPIGWYL